MLTMRRAGATSAATLIALALTIVIAHAVAPEWLRGAGLDLWNYPVALAAKHEASQESQSIGAHYEQLQQEIKLGDHIASQLAAGDLSLEVAVDELEPTLSRRSSFDDNVQHNYQANSVRQSVARYLIQRIPRIMKNDPERLAEVLCQLECEYAQLK